MGSTRIGFIIRDARTKAQLTLEQVADKVGVTPGALSHIESGRRLPSPRNAMMIAQVLGIPDDEILSALDEEHSLRRESAAYESRSGLSPRSSSGAPRAYSAQPIEAMFDAELSSASASPSPGRRSPADRSPSYRDLARWSPDTSQRVDALDQLADTAASAIRTLRGMLEDEDAVVRREARRLLHELDVRLPEE
jgi:transcriptional regulator with XRE-family HTH domain